MEVTMTLNDDAQKLLNFFKAKGFGLADYAYPKDMEDCFGGDATACERAQAELKEVGLLELGMPPPRHIVSGVRSAALTREGARLLQSQPGETAT
jgi:hypothetical protein